MPDPARRRIPLIPLGIVILVAAVAAVVLLRRDDATGPVPVPTSGCYDAMVSAFYSGTVALIVQDPDRPEPELKRAAECVPEEPAPWANLALYYLRGRTRLDAAEAAIKKALLHAPNSSEVEAIYGHLENTRGKVNEAVAHFRKAVELDPRNIHARWLLADLLERQRSPGYEAEVHKQIEGILTASPDNLVALTRLGTIAARRGDGAVMSKVIAGIDRQSAAWPADVTSALKELKARQNNPSSATIQFLQLANLLKPQSAYQRSQGELMPPDKAVGVPIERFLRLPSPSARPAAPDMALTFKEAESLFREETPSTPLLSAKRILHARLRPEITWNLGESFRLPATKEMPASTLLSDGRVLQIVTGRSVKSLPFPGGAAGEPPSPRGITIADLNYDFRPDLVCAGAGGIRLYLQGADGLFKDASTASKLSPALLNTPAYGAWIADTDLDGDLDVVVGYPQAATQVLRNNGDGTFKALPLFEASRALRAFAWADFDGDGDPDPVFVDARGNLTMLSNERSGRFLPRTLPSSSQPVVSIAAGDLNRDLLVDLIALLGDGSLVRYSDKDDGQAWETSPLAQGGTVSAPGEAASIFLPDLDNNGGMDILVTRKNGTQLWLAGETGEFSPLSAELGPGIQDVADTNSDGLLDLIALGPSGAPLVRSNQSKAGYLWLDLRPRATFVARGESSGDSRINSFGIGGEVEARSALLVQKQVIDGPTMHFGLGKNPKVDYARFTWPNGSVQGEFTLNANQGIIAVQRLKGSCPWLFAWNGRKMEFVTDVLWKSPLGLRINSQDTAGVMTTLDWVKIRGDQLAPKDGHYDVRVTAELWETHFFDQVSMMVVDHPADTEVFIDERFAFPPPAVKLHAVSTPRPIVRAVDDRGKDVTDSVSGRDAEYLDTFGRGAYQGITRDHFVEVEIPSAAAAKTGICLVGFGWIHPTDSSINVALSQGSHPPPTGLSIEVPGGNRWITAKSGLGFPAGKNKTVLLDLTEILRKYPGTTRFRLRTNLELYWDSLQWAEWKPETALRTTRLEAREADLRYRGFSATSQANDSSPELPDYDRIWTRGQMWRDLIGFYTRFGDVRELLRKVDDRYVILNAADEMAFRFPEQPAPRPGWKRDYVFISDGWEKDGDYNTGFSKTVLPLPSHDDPRYATPPTRLQDDPVYRRYPEDWENYHTRWVAPDGFRATLLPRLK